jgi:AraC-like DNA-binding protein
VVVTARAKRAAAWGHMEKSSVSIYFVRSALEPARARGLDADVDALLREAGIAPALLRAPHSRVTAHSFAVLLLGLARLLDDELFGLDARRMKVGSFAMLGHLLVDCDSLGDALRRMARFFNLILDDFHCRLDSDDVQARLVIAPAAGRAPAAFGYEALLAMQYGLACWLGGRRLPVLSAAFAYPAPPCGAEYARIYSENLRFDQAETVIAIARAHLELPVVQDRRTLKQFLRHAPGNIVLKYRNREGLAAQVRQRLRAAEPAAWPDFDHVARQLGINPSTLRRRLEDEGQSFRAIKDQLRSDLAIDLLCHSEKNMLDISLALGFSDASAFHRAFKKWRGAGPGAYRQQHQPG